MSYFPLYLNMLLIMVFIEFEQSRNWVFLFVILMIIRTVIIDYREYLTIMKLKNKVKK